MYDRIWYAECLIHEVPDGKTEEWLYHLFISQGGQFQRLVCCNQL